MGAKSLHYKASSPVLGSLLFFCFDLLLIILLFPFRSILMVMGGQEVNLGCCSQALFTIIVMIIIIIVIIINYYFEIGSLSGLGLSK